MKILEYIGPFDAVDISPPDSETILTVTRGAPVEVDDTWADGCYAVVEVDDNGDEYVVVPARGGLLAQADNWREVTAPARKQKLPVDAENVEV